MSSPAPEQVLKPRLSDDVKARLQTIRPVQRFAETGGWTPIPNVLAEMDYKISGNIQRILLQEIMNKTFGAVNTPEWALIKLTHLAARGPYTRRAFELAADEGVDRGLFERRKIGRFWAFKTVPEDWGSVPDYKYHRTPRLILADGRDAVTGRFALPAHRFLPMSELQIADPAGVRFVSAVQTKLPVEVSLDPAPDGTISIIVSDPPEPPASAETPYLVNTVRLSFASGLEIPFIEAFNKTPDDELVDQIVDLCAGAPVDLLLDRIEEKRRAGKLKSAGLVLDLAADVGKAWKADEKRRVAAAVEQARADARRSVHCRMCADTGFVYSFNEAKGQIRSRCPDCGGQPPGDPI